jgi:hypothetical protein
MNADTSILELLRQLRDDTAALVREEMRLAKTEMAEKLGRAGRHLAYLAAGGAIAAAALVMLLMAFGSFLTSIFIERGLSAGASPFLGFGIVALLAAAVAVLLVMRSVKALSSDSLAPTRTARSLQEDARWAKDKMP